VQTLHVNAVVIMKTVSLQDEMQLIDNVSVIFHSAATVKFDEDLTK
jgi:hypothetical protein